MEKISEYILQEKIGETNKSIVYRGAKDSADTTVIIKLLKIERASPTDIARFKQEYNLIKSIDLPGVIKTNDIITHEGSIAIILEDFDGISLKKIIKNESIDLEFFLEVALNVAESLGELHIKNIVHGDIKPNNIIINRNRNIIKIGDFGIARVVTHESDDLYSAGIIDGTLAYLSPEQTGRINRSVDHRTDLYSLGVTFYEMLTGITPFRSNDPLEIIHSHIARKPVSPKNLNQAIPEVISQIIMKLLSKSPEERYQNSFGLASDLADCRKLLKNGNIEEFEIGINDISTSFHLPQMLVGRDAETKLLLSAFERVQSGGKEIVLVSGVQGIGKSTLVHEIQRPVLLNEGYFITGRFDQNSREVPFCAITQAFSGLISQMLTESRERIHERKKKVLDQLGPNGKVITDIIPDVAQIIGIQSDTIALGPQESLNRLNYVFKQFLKALIGDQSLVIFLDDLQWADPASMNILNVIMADSELAKILIICAYRELEVYDRHSLLSSIDEITRWAPVTKISLPPLTASDVEEIFKYHLKSDAAGTKPLAEIVYNKTGGNPFFIHQFIEMLFDKNLLTYSTASSVRGKGKISWTWDIAKIRDVTVTDNVVELMSGKIALLNESAIRTLEAASCIGMQFDLELVSQVIGASLEDTLAQLADAAIEGLVVLSGRSFQFYHDKIQEAAYIRIPLPERGALHHKIGMIMLENAGCELDDKIISIVDQINRGKDRIQGDDEIIFAAGVNLRAGIKAKSSSAFNSANNYFSVGIELLGGKEASPGIAGNGSSRWWDIQYDLILSLYIEAAEAAYMCTEYDETERFAEIIFTRAKTLLEKIRMYEILMHTFWARNKMVEAVQTGLKVLKMLGVSLPGNPGKFSVIAAFIRNKIALMGKSIDDLEALPVATDQYFHARMNIMASLGTLIYYSSPNLVPLIVFKAMQLYLKYGNCKHSPFGYAGYGLMLCSIGDIDNGYRFGTMAIRLIDKMDATGEAARTHHTVNSTIRHWKEHNRDLLKPMLFGHQKAMESGDIEFSGISLSVYCFTIFFLGNGLVEVLREIEKYMEIASKLKMNSPINLMKMYSQFILILLGKEKYSTRLVGRMYDEEKMLPVHISTSDRTNIFFVHFNKIILNYLFGEYTSALKSCVSAEPEIDSVTGCTVIPVFYMFDSLTRLFLYDSMGVRHQKVFLSKAIKNQKKMKKWAYHAPMNYRHKFNLVEAEIARCRGHFLAAEVLYDKAVRDARDNEYINDEAVACECAARFYLSRGLLDIASAYIIKAYTCYVNWGAIAKVQQLEKKYSRLLGDRPLRQLLEDDTKSFTANTTHSLDLSTVLKASRAISSEIRLGSILEKMLRLAIENAGAQKGFLLLEKEGRLFIEASGSVDEDIRVLTSEPVDTSLRISRAIVNFVNQTKENVLLEDACRKGMFTGDPYIMLNKSRSVICAPIKDKGKVAGIIYLENNLISGSFTPERLELLNILSAQAAISIENARLVLIEKEKAAIDHEIEMAEKIQRSLLPGAIPLMPGGRVAFKYVPMMGIGGDFVNMYYQQASGKLGLFICDVSGHGIPAAITASMISMSLKVFWDAYIDRPAALLIEIRNSMRGKMKDIFFTACACTLDPARGTLVLASAGHPKLVIISRDMNVRMAGITGRLVTDLLKVKVEEETLQIVRGDRVVLYTDGIIEAENEAGEMFGSDDDVFCKLLLEDSLSSYTPEEMCEQVHKRLLEFTHSKNLNDDMTILVCEYLG